MLGAQAHCTVCSPEYTIEGFIYTVNQNGFISTHEFVNKLHPFITRRNFDRPKITISKITFVQNLKKFLTILKILSLVLENVDENENIAAENNFV